MTFFPFGCRCLYLLLLSCVCLVLSLYLHVIDCTWICLLTWTSANPPSSPYCPSCTCRCLITQLAPLSLLGFTWLNWLYWFYVLGWIFCYLTAQPPYLIKALLLADLLVKLARSCRLASLPHLGVHNVQCALHILVIGRTVQGCTKFLPHWSRLCHCLCLCPTL